MIKNCAICLVFTAVLIDTVRGYLPIVIWHSAGEYCCGEEFQTYSQFLKSKLGHDLYIKPVQLSDHPSTDTLRSLTSHPFDQIKQVCEQLQKDPKLKDGYHGIGLSQGGLFLRGLAQACPNPPMKNLVSLGGPQQGVHQYPSCEQQFGNFCPSLHSIVNWFGYFWLFQKTIAPSTYWHDTNEESYRKGSTFLALINNEKEYNANYVINLHNLRRIILVKYEKDSAIVPSESSWFGYYDRWKNEHPMEDTEVYTSDKLGLKALKDSGRLLRLKSPGRHLELKTVWFTKNIIPFLIET